MHLLETCSAKGTRIEDPQNCETAQNSIPEGESDHHCLMNTQAPVMNFKYWGFNG